MRQGRIVALIVAVLCIGTLALAQLADPPLQNWASPPYWTPPAGSQARHNLAVATGVVGTTDISTGIPPSPVTILPFIAVTPCRLVDTRHGPKDSSSPEAAPRGTRAAPTPAARSAATTSP